MPPEALSGAGGGGVDQGEEVALALFCNFEGLFGGVNCPAKDDLMRAPGGVTFADIFEGDWLLPCIVVLSVQPEEFVDGEKKVLRHFPSLVRPSLYYTDEIVEVYFDMI